MNREAQKTVRRQSRKLHDLKLAFSEFYLSLILLQNYQNLNFTGFRKILKKHDKLLKIDNGANWRIHHVECAIFYTNKEIGKLILETENLFTTNLEQGDRQKAMKRLRVPPLGDQQSPWTTYKLGLFSGAFIVMIIAIVLSASLFTDRKDDWRIVFRLYRGTFLIILDVFLLGINVYGWRSSGVNHVLIFELDPRNHLSEQHLMEFRVVSAPFFHVGFADFWLADQLNSLVPALLDFEYLVCFYINNVNWVENTETGVCLGEVTPYVRPLIACLPAWFRFAQCLRRYRDSKDAFPHLVNAGKYSTTFFVVIFSTVYHLTKDPYGSSYSPFFYIWLGAAVFSSFYAFLWDIKMDWGYFDKNAGENVFLREEIVYSSKGYYYFSIIEDFLLRFGWTFSVSLTELGNVHGYIVLTVLAPLEVFRRFVWNFFRLENEHLNNCGNFRAVRDISVAPIDASDQAVILNMMDEEDGVDNRKRDKKTGRIKGLEKTGDLVLSSSLILFMQWEAGREAFAQQWA
ncbi:Xenotropic and polytropic retrovirus receptor 1 [Nymphon striatum]|nr:Xenotropic and polytropic retrovirus receptor 1 [Nymphon striatum]